MYRAVLQECNNIISMDLSNTNVRKLVQDITLHYSDNNMRKIKLGNCNCRFPLIYFQKHATLHSLFISAKLLYMFRVVSSPIIRHIIVFTVSGTCQTVTATCRYCGRVGTGMIVVWELY